MKKIYFTLFSTLILGGIMVSCSEGFLEQPPIGTYGEETLKTKAGVEGVLIGAYANLDGKWDGTRDNQWGMSGTNWVYGTILGGDAYKGSDPGDQPPLNQLERHEPLPTNVYLLNRFTLLYDGIDRANDALRLLAEVPEIEEADRERIMGEARFLRGHYHFEAKRMWNRVPYIDEYITDYRVPNDRDIWPDMEADFKFAMDHLPPVQVDVGRANQWAAAAYYAKVLIYQEKYAMARPVLDEIMAYGVTADGIPYGLNESFHDNFRAATKNSRESVFAIQYSVNDGANGQNGGAVDVLNFPYGGGPGTCCGFLQPSQSLVNAYRVDDQGLPFLDTFNDQDVKNDQGLRSTDPFTPDTAPLDPRLDWTVGRRSIPYLDWGPHPGQAWIRDQVNGGPYSPKKNVYYKSEEGQNTDGSGWTKGFTANNYPLIRYADVLLWAAETEAQLGNLEQATEYVNRIRKRAAHPEGWVKNPDGTPAANYKIGLYPIFSDKASALKAIQFERKLELAMEGHRFFDLVRWGIASQELNAYLRIESERRQYLKGATFEAGKDEYFPIPEQAIIQSAIDGVPTLLQNPGY